MLLRRFFTCQWLMYIILQPFTIIFSMWTCQLCNQQFVRANQYHSCTDKQVTDFFKNKPKEVLELFDHLVITFQQLDDVNYHATKSMIAFSVKTRIAYITKVGKNFIDVSFMFNRPFNDNLCFTVLARFPAQNNTIITSG